MMELIRDVVIVFGWVSMLLLILGLWTHLDVRRKRRETEGGNVKFSRPD